jgi:hypothetical protein
MGKFNLSQFRTAPDDASPERWRFHFVGPVIALYAAFATAVTLLSMAR